MFSVSCLTTLGIDGAEKQAQRGAGHGPWKGLRELFLGSGSCSPTGVGEGRKEHSRLGAKAWLGKDLFGNPQSLPLKERKRDRAEMRQRVSCGAFGATLEFGLISGERRECDGEF